MKGLIGQPKIRKVSEQAVLKFQFAHFSVWKLRGNIEDIFHFIQKITPRKRPGRVVQPEICYQRKILIPDLDIVGDLFRSLDPDNIHGMLHLTGI